MVNHILACLHLNHRDVAKCTKSSKLILGWLRSRHLIFSRSKHHRWRLLRLTAPHCYFSFSLNKKKKWSWILPVLCANWEGCGRSWLVHLCNETDWTEGRSLCVWNRGREDDVRKKARVQSHAVSHCWWEKVKKKKNHKWDSLIVDCNGKKTSFWKYVLSCPTFSLTSALCSGGINEALKFILDLGLTKQAQFKVH